MESARRVFHGRPCNDTAAADDDGSDLLPIVRKKTAEKES